MTHAQKPKAYIFCPSRSRARLLSLSRWHNSCIFCNVSMSSRFNTTAIRVAWKIQLLWNHATTFLCRISCSPSHKWFCFFKISPLLAYHIIQRRSTMRESRFSSCQSKNVLWWVEWSRLVKNGDFFLFTLRRWIVHVFCARMFLLCLIPFLTYQKYFYVWYNSNLFVICFPAYDMRFQNYIQFDRIYINMINRISIKPVFYFYVMSCLIQ